MKAFVAGLIFCFLSSFPVKAQQAMSEEEQLGTLAGLAASCNVGEKLYDFEAIASRMIANKSFSPQMENERSARYAAAKALAFQRQSGRHGIDCATVITQFSNMSIFNFEVYDDGSVKTDKGQYLLPRGQKKFNPEAKKIYPQTDGAVVPVTQTQQEATFQAQTTEPEYGVMKPVKKQMKPVKRTLLPVKNKMKRVNY